MQMIRESSSHVNTPTITTSACQTDALLAIQDVLADAGCYPVYQGQGRIACQVFAARSLFPMGITFDVVLSAIQRVALADDSPDLDDAMSAAHEEAMFAAWGASGVMSDHTDAELDAMYAAMAGDDITEIEALYREPWSQYRTRKGLSN